MARIRIGLGLGVALLAASASAEIYSWRDAQGVEHFTTDLHQVPAQQRAAAEAEASGASGGSYNAGGGGDATPFPEPAPAATPGPQPGAASPAVDAEETAGGRNEAWWRKSHREIVDRIAELERRSEACEDMGPAARPGSNYERKSAALDDCAEAKSHLDATRRGLEKFEEDARRAGVPPGWLR